MTTAEREAFLQIILEVRRDRAELFAREGEPGAALVVHSTCNYILRLLEDRSTMTYTGSWLITVCEAGSARSRPAIRERTPE